MARYKLVSVKYSRREHKKDADGNLMYRDEDKKNPVYELKSYGIGATVDLTPAEAKRMRKDIQPVGGAIEFLPDDSGDGDNESDSGTVDPEIAEALTGNIDQVLAYIEEHSDDDDILAELRDAEQASKKPRKGVLDRLNELLGE